MKKKWPPWVLPAAAGFGILLAGALAGGWTGVLQKAIFICLECIGIG